MKLKDHARPDESLGQRPRLSTEGCALSHSTPDAGLIFNTKVSCRRHLYANRHGGLARRLVAMRCALDVVVVAAVGVLVVQMAP